MKGVLNIMIDWDSFECVDEPTVERRNHREPILREWYSNKHEGLCGGLWYPWIKLEVGDWFFVPWKRTGLKTKFAQRVRSDLTDSRKRVTWVPGFKTWKITTRSTEYKGKPGLMIKRKEGKK